MAGGDEHAHRGAVVDDLRRRRALVDAHARRAGGGRKPRDELAGVDERRVGLLPDAAEVRGRGHLGLHRLAVEDLVLVAEALQQLGALLDPGQLVLLERNAEVAGQLEVAVDAEPLDVGDEALEVLATEPLQLGHLLGEAREAVLDPVRERAEREAAVAPARTEADGVRLEHDDVAPGSSAFACSAAQSPVKPAPTMQRSASAGPSSWGSGSRGGSASSQYGRTVASAKAARCAAVGAVSGHGNAIGRESTEG